MCGRYSLGMRPSAIRQQLRETGMYAESAPEDDEIRETYNFAPGYHGIVYRADTPDWGAGGGNTHQLDDAEEDSAEQENDNSREASPTAQTDASGAKEPVYKLQAMKWGLVPFWTKRNPDYGSLMRTINCRDDSLYEDKGMWTSMKRKKRCIVVCQGFYEWLKKNNGKEKIPHFIKRKDGQLMCFAGLWDCVQYEGSDEKHYTYSIITTSANKQMEPIHDRMPCILENSSSEVTTWLDPNTAKWTKELQSLLRPYKGELDIYPVHKDVGKVGNNSSTFIVPVSSAENKHNIANFFNKASAKGAPKASSPEKVKKQEPKEEDLDQENSESNAPLPATPGVKREHSDASGDEVHEPPPSKSRRVSEAPSSRDASPKYAAGSQRKTRSATSNTAGKSPSKVKSETKDGNSKITQFFNK